MKTRHAILCLIILAFMSMSCAGNDRDDPAITGNTESAELQNKNIILIIIDTLRADHLSCYGYHRFTSPTMDSLAAEGTMWTNAHSHAPWTLPSIASIWTGLSPQSHRTLSCHDWKVFNGPRINYGLDTNLPTLPSTLDAEGYATRGIANVFLLNEKHGFDRGFDEYSCSIRGQDRLEISVDSLILWMGEHSQEKFFCMLHLYDVHDPYDPPENYRTLFKMESSSSATTWSIDGDSILNADDREHLIASYDGEIARVDDNLSRLFSWLREQGLDKSTLIVITSDHGEEFLEHGWVLHGRTLYEEVLHVPLIMSGPGIESGRIDTSPVGLFDIMPTLLAWADIPCDAVLDGMDILNEDIPSDRVIPASGVAFLHPDSNQHLASALIGGKKTIGYEDLERFISFDLDIDPGEHDPEDASPAETEAVLYYWATPPRGFPELAEPDDEEIEVLRDLGYI